MTREREERILRSKYLDWCSARVAETFLKLSPEEIFELAEAAESGAAGAGAPDAVVERSIGGAAASAVGTVEAVQGREAVRDSSYRAVVARVTEVLAERLNLPDFDDWLTAYRAEPERYESEMVGFWRREADPAE